jgi:hypothetical protein
MALLATTKVISNRKNLSTTLHFTATDTITISGNNTVSEIAIDTEVLTGATITQVWYGSPSGASSYWTLERGTAVVAILDSTGYIDFAGNGNAITIDTANTLVAELTGSVGFLMVELQKIGNLTANSVYFQT